MKNKYGIKVGDVIKTKQDVYHGIPNYGDVVVLDLLPKAKALIKFINTGNVREVKLFDLNNGSVRDHETYKRSVESRVKPKFNELVEELWKDWNPESGIDGAKYAPVLCSEAGSKFLTTIVGKTLVDDWFYEKYWGIALIDSGLGYISISSKKDNIEKFFRVKLSCKIKQIKLHHFIRGHMNFKGYVVDHVNGDKTDNRFSNLRTATVVENGRNSRKSSSMNKHSQYKGVFYNKNKESRNGKLNKCWRALIHADGRQICKWFHTEIEAAEYYDELAKHYHGEFAKLNFEESGG